MSKPALHAAHPALELLEQGIALLRRTPGSLLLCYYVGAIPFWLALLYFIEDSARSAFAGERLFGASFFMALLYVHMKCWQSVFAASLRDLLLEKRVPWNARRIGRLAACQVLWQPTGLLMRPLGTLATLPLVWVSSFYQNLTVLGDGRAPLAGELPPVRQAMAQASLWSRQAHGVMLWLTLFAGFVWLNFALLLALLPQFLKTFFGWETMASRNFSGWLLNSTFPAVTVALTLLALGPLWKAVFALRCFYGESVRSGADLRVQLQATR